MYANRGRSNSELIDPHRLIGFKRVAGEGDIDERCRRILNAFRESWWGTPGKAQPEPDPERHDPQAWWGFDPEAWEES